MNMGHVWSGIVAAAVVLFGVITSGDAAVPNTIGFQGYLADSEGAPVNGTVDMTFGLYSLESGGSVLWSETQTGVAVTNGVYSVTLGSVTPLNLPFDQHYWLGVKAGSDDEMTPRTPLTSVPYAFRAGTADGLASGAVTTGKIQNGAVTPDKLGNICQNGQILVRAASGWTCGSLP